jgi:hypothetical protein
MTVGGVSRDEYAAHLIVRGDDVVDLPAGDLLDFELGLRVADRFLH